MNEMMKKHSATALMALLLLATAFSPPASAQLGTQTSPRLDYSDSSLSGIEMDDAESTFSQHGILPDHPLYFMKRFAESIQVLLAPGPEEKARLHLAFAKTRLAEARKMIEIGKTSAASQAVEDFNREIDAVKRAEESDDDAPAIAEETKDVLEKSKVVLQIALDEAPEAARPALEQALSNAAEREAHVTGVMTRWRERKRDAISGDKPRKLIEGAEKDSDVCAQVITPARNPETREIEEFPTPCDVPDGWERINHTMTEDTEPADNVQQAAQGRTKTTVAPQVPPANPVQEQAPSIAGAVIQNTELSTPV